MKKLLCFLLCSVLIFSSVSLCFAQDWSATDSQNLSNAASRLQTIITTLNTTNSTLNTISNRVLYIQNALFDGNHSVAYWVSAINSWMSPIYNSIIQMPLDLDKIYLSLGYNTDVDGDGNLEYHSYLSDLNSLFTQIQYTNYPYYASANGGLVSGQSFTNNYPSVIVATLNGINAFLAQDYMYTYGYMATNYNTSQNVVNWGNLGTSTFTPSSVADGLYKYLGSIQAPIARLSYVLASDERIEAQEAAAANEEAIVDNFIDSSGNGAASPSDIGSVSDLSSGYKQNFGSDASPAGIFDIFNSDHATWFSQETKNQLDTTTPTRLTKSSDSETPLLDKQIEDIYNALGVKQP